MTLWNRFFVSKSRETGENRSEGGRANTFTVTIRIGAQSKTAGLTKADARDRSLSRTVIPLLPHAASEWSPLCEGKVSARRVHRVTNSGHDTGCVKEIPTASTDRQRGSLWSPWLQRCGASKLLPIIARTSGGQKTRPTVTRRTPGHYISSRAVRWRTSSVLAPE